MGSKLALLATGIAAGVIAALVVQSLTKHEEKGARSARPDVAQAERVTQLERENDQLNETVAQMTSQVGELQEKLTAAEARAEKAAPPKKPDAAPVDTSKPPTDEEIEAELKAFGNSLQQIIRGRPGAEAVKKRLREFLERGGKPVLDKLIEGWQDDARGYIPRLIAAHALAQSGNVDALESLKAVLRDPDSGMLAQRTAAHGLAFSDAEGLDTVLSQTAHNAKDTGARANAAFGLARRGVDEGVTLYMEITDEVLEKGDPAALQYLGGFALLNDKALPGMRDRLLSYKEPQTVLTLIEILKARKDKGAVPNLKKLAYDSSQPVSVQKAAQGALKALGAAPK